MPIQIMPIRTMTLVAALCLTTLTQADSVTLIASKDNTLFQDLSGSLSSGAGQFLFAGNNSGSEARRGLLQFDLRSIPPTAQITSVVLDIHISRIARSAQPLSLYRVLESWGEGTSDSGQGGAGAAATAGDATWLHRSFDDALWTNPGGFFNNVPLATAPVALGHTTFSGPGISGLVQSWLADPTANFGLLIQGDESITGSAVRFDSRENADPAARPRLIIAYTCPSDYNLDDVVDFFDYLDFVADFSSNSPAADFNADTVIDFFDYLDFVAAFSTGC
jgi:hypothetical protein